MKTSLDCIQCNIKQLKKISKLLNVSEALKEEATRKIFASFANIDFNKSNPETMKNTWDIISSVYNDNDPYKIQKDFYNKKLYNLYPKLDQMINNYQDKFQTALKVAIIGNIIDFVSNLDLKEEDIFNRINNIDDIKFTIDDSQLLKEKLLKTKQLLYIGDNCGEIVFDKLFIKYIKLLNPDIKVYFGVRGGPVLNDITIEDAKTVKMEELATVISTGINISGTVLERSSKEFNNIFNTSDLIIAKGQGNYESLNEVKKENLFFLLMAKCPYVASVLNVDTFSYNVKLSIK